MYLTHTMRRVCCYFYRDRVALLFWLCFFLIVSGAVQPSGSATTAVFPSGLLRMPCVTPCNGVVFSEPTVVFNRFSCKKVLRTAGEFRAVVIRVFLGNENHHIKRWLFAWRNRWNFPNVEFSLIHKGALGGREVHLDSFKVSRDYEVRRSGVSKVDDWKAYKAIPSSLLGIAWNQVGPLFMVEVVNSSLQGPIRILSTSGSGDFRIFSSLSSLTM